MKFLRRLFPRRLDVQLALVCTIVLVVTMPWFIVHVASDDFERFLNNIQKQTKVFVENIAITSVEHIVTSDFISIEKLLMRSVLFPGVIDIQVLNNNGQVLSDVYLNEGAQPEARYTKKSITTLPKVNHSLSILNENSFIVWAPVNSGSSLGWVKLNYSLQSANDYKQERIRNYMKDASVMTVILITLLILAMRRPLRMISDAADFSSRLDEKTGEQIPMQRQSKELDKLFFALNKASVNLYEQNSTIKTIVKDLETQKQALDEHSIVSISNTDGIIIYANDKLLSSTGYNKSELIGKTHSIIISGFHDKGLWNTINKGKVWHGDIDNLNKKNQNIWMRTTIVPFLDATGVPYEYVVIQTDITNQKTTESLLSEKNKSLKELTEQLESKVKSRTDELLKVNEELLQLNIVKSNFVSVVSHELRTPLTSIKSFVEILEDDFEDLDAETRRHYLSIINEESVRLGNLINDVLDLQKIDSGKMTWHEEKTELRKLASSTIELFSKSYKDKGLELRTDFTKDEFFANIDSDKIKQVLTNLLSNSYKFTEQGSVTLKLTKVVKQPTTLIVDDDRDCRELLELQLLEMGIDVIACSGAKEAIAVIQDDSKKIDLLITDIFMPEMNGIELIKTIRGFNEKLPIIAISSSDDSNILKSLFGYNVMAYHVKSFKQDECKHSIEHVFGEIRNSNFENEMIEISVIDTGLGIQEDELDKVFDHFHQVDNSETRIKGGSGLGLCICKDIIEHHGGKLWVTSTYGEGSRFTFNLPLLCNSTKRIDEILVDVDITTQECIDNALLNQNNLNRLL